MRAYIICPVRHSQRIHEDAIYAHVRRLEEAGHTVHLPQRDVNQNDPTGVRICTEHAAAMEQCDEVHVFWDVTSSGSHFDLGMAWILQKPTRLIQSFNEDKEGKSYEKVVLHMEETF